MAIVYLGLGSNLGDRAANLRAAIEALAPRVQALTESRMYETPPWGVVDQPEFLNMALKGETELSPAELREHVKHIEQKVGRTPTDHWGPRVVDIDILLYADRIVGTPDLTIPHPHMHKRAFVLVPLAEIAAEVVHPALGFTILDLLQQVDTSDIAVAEA